MVVQRIDLRTKRHIYWGGKVREVDLSDPEQEKWWAEQVLQQGRLEDVRELGFDRIERLLPVLELPTHLRELWQDFFVRRAAGHRAGGGT